MWQRGAAGGASGASPASATWSFATRSGCSCAGDRRPLGAPGSSPAPKATLEPGAPRITTQLSSVKALARHLPAAFPRLLERRTACVPLLTLPCHKGIKLRQFNL